MRESWNRLRTLVPPLAVSAVVVLVAVRFAPLRKSNGPSTYESVTATLPPGPAVNVPIGASKGASAHHLRIEDEVRSHVHRRHDETIVVMSGRGRMRLGSETVDVVAGEVIIVPRGTVHALIVTGEPVEAISVFTPPFDGNDRVFLDE
jgi:mannose-6-phosphate isomerase-like protein (cupin superfamily)